jgi:hypothetical protein
MPGAILNQLFCQDIGQDDPVTVTQLFKGGGAAVDLFCHLVQGAVFLCNNDRLGININGINLHRTQFGSCNGQDAGTGSQIKNLSWSLFVEGVGTSRLSRHSRQSRVVSWPPVPKAMPGSSTITARPSS